MHAVEEVALLDMLTWAMDRRDSNVLVHGALWVAGTKGDHGGLLSAHRPSDQKRGCANLHSTAQEARYKRTATLSI